MKVCKECKNDVFGGGYCKYHQFRRYMRGGDLYKPKTRVKPINKESTKQKKVTKQYLQRLSEFWDESIKNGTDRCFFCDEKMLKRDNIHHLRGRGKIALEEEWWVNTHQNCHMDFHFKPVEWLMQQTWYSGFMERLCAKDSQSYGKQKRREEKDMELF